MKVQKEAAKLFNADTILTCLSEQAQQSKKRGTKVGPTFEQAKNFASMWSEKLKACFEGASLQETSKLLQDLQDLLQPQGSTYMMSMYY